jgi:hypothetical protein
MLVRFYVFNFDFKINTMASASSSQSLQIVKGVNKTWDSCAFFMCSLFDYLERYEGYPGINPIVNNIRNLVLTISQ